MLETAMNTFTKLEKEIEINNKNIVELEIKQSELSKKKEMLKFWINLLDFRNENSIKQHVISKVIPVFNTMLQQNLDFIYNGTMLVVFDSIFNESIIYEDQEYEYEELSTGERMKLNMAINLSIFDMARINLSGSNIMFLDEIFVNIDSPSIKLLNLKLS